MIRFFRTVRERSLCHGWRTGAPALGLSAALALGGCSISMPIPGLIDNEPLGSIRAKPHDADAPLAAANWPLARPALGEALKAGADADPSLWSNPESRTGGAFLAVGPVFQRDGAECRAVIARVGSGETAKRWRGAGCRRDGDALAFEDAEPIKGL